MDILKWSTSTLKLYSTGVNVLSYFPSLTDRIYIIFFIIFYSFQHSTSVAVFFHFKYYTWTHIKSQKKIQCHFRKWNPCIKSFFISLQGGQKWKHDCGVAALDVTGAFPIYFDWPCFMQALDRFPMRATTHSR